MAHGPSARTIRRRVAAATRRSIDSATQNCGSSSCSTVTVESGELSVAPDVSRSSDETLDSAIDSSSNDTTLDSTQVPPERRSYDTDSDGPLDSSDDDDDDAAVAEDDRMIAMLKRLAQWKLQHNITNTAFNDLLKILRHEHPSLPKDSRTVVAPPNNVTYRPVGDGTYHHFGIISGVTNASIGHKDHLHNGFTVQLQLGIDGLPVHRSTKWHLWPILGRVENAVFSNVFIIGVFFGESKPSSCPNFLREFIDEYAEIQRAGFQLHGYNVTLAITTVICDAQARAFVKCVKQYNHTFGCDKCCVEGEYDGRMMFLEQNCARRTDDSFRRRQQKEHHDDTNPKKPKNAATRTEASIAQSQQEKRDDDISPFETAGLGA